MDVDWSKLLNQKRRKPSRSAADSDETRTEIERDFDRILFSTPVRRLADKTQVFPLDPNDSVRTRLVHSYEVSNLARSLGVALGNGERVGISKDLLPHRNIPALLASIGLAHDLGNPPFGHQGEASIQAWMKMNECLLDPLADEAMRQDFLRFEGNAQTLRLLTRLQVVSDEFGLNLTYATLAALMKYSVPSDQVDASHAAAKKHGFFQSEKEIVHEIWEATGLGQGSRHPMTYIMEACDDAAYSVLDVEDAVKKRLASFEDVIAYLRHASEGDVVVEQVCKRSVEDNGTYRLERLSPSELNDISMQKLRVYALQAVVRGAREAFETNRDSLERGRESKPLLELSTANKLVKLLKKFAFTHAYRHESVLRIELMGHTVIHELMDMLWAAIKEHPNRNKDGSRTATPFAAFAYQKISENYRRVFENDTSLPVRYGELQLLTDMISGMTDSFAVSLHSELKGFYGR